MFKPFAITRCKTERCWSVCLEHLESGRKYWLDVFLDGKVADMNVEWNQYIFYTTDKDDMARKEFQEDCDNFDEACSEAISILESEGEVFQDTDGEWHLRKAWEGERTWTV